MNDRGRFVLCKERLCCLLEKGMVVVRVQGGMTGAEVGC
jgi:hypothetical protein